MRISDIRGLAIGALPDKLAQMPCLCGSDLEHWPTLRCGWRRRKHKASREHERAIGKLTEAQLTILGWEQRLFFSICRIFSRPSAFGGNETNKLAGRGDSF